MKRQFAELRNPKVAAVVAMDLGAAWAAQHEANVCRARNGIAPCPGGYGAIGTRTAVDWGFSAFLASMSIYGHHQGYRDWALPALIPTTLNSITAIQAGTKSCQHGYHFLPGTKNTCVDNDEEYQFIRK